MKSRRHAEPHYFLTPQGRVRLNAQLAVVLNKVMRHRYGISKLGRRYMLNRKPYSRPEGKGGAMMWSPWRAAAHVRGRRVGYFRWMLCEPCKSVPTRKVQELVRLANHNLKPSDKNYLDWRVLIDWTRVESR